MISMPSLARFPSTPGTPPMTMKMYTSLEAYVGLVGGAWQVRHPGMHRPSRENSHQS